jgi:hypothetical protein
MGSTNEDDSLDAGVGLESRGFHNKIRRSQCGEDLHGWFPQCLLPISAVYARNLQLRKQSPHTVPHKDIVFVIRIKFIYFGQFFAQT